MLNYFGIFRKWFDDKPKEVELEDELFEQVVERMKAYHRINKFKSRIVLEYLLKAYQSAETIEDLYQTIYLKRNVEEEEKNVE
jgi:hypothetical protein